MYFNIFQLFSCLSMCLCIYVFTRGDLFPNIGRPFYDSYSDILLHCFFPLASRVLVDASTPCVYVHLSNQTWQSNMAIKHGNGMRWIFPRFCIYGCGFAASDGCLVSQLVYVDVPYAPYVFPMCFP